MIAHLIYTLITGDYPGALAAYGIYEDDALIDRLITAHDVLATVLVMFA